MSAFSYLFFQKMSIEIVLFAVFAAQQQLVFSVQYLILLNLKRTCTTFLGKTQRREKQRSKVMTLKESFEMSTPTSCSSLSVATFLLEAQHHAEYNNVSGRKPSNNCPNKTYYQSCAGDNQLQETTAIEQKRPIHIAAILSTAASYGAIIGTLFLVALPLECARISTVGTTKSVHLGIFIFLAGITQLISPLIGMASDSCTTHPLGKRRPFLILGCVMAVVGFLGMNYGSTRLAWTIYGVSFAVAMSALNIIYSVMVALIPDLVSEEQTGYVSRELLCGPFVCMCVVANT